MTIYVNSKAFEFNSTVNIEALLLEAKINDHRGMALAVNNSVVPKSEWNGFVMKENDKVIVIKATQGG